MSASERGDGKKQYEYLKYSLLVSPELDAQVKDALRLRQAHGQSVKLSDLLRDYIAQGVDRDLATPTAAGAKRVTLDLPPMLVQGLEIAGELNSISPTMMAQQILTLEVRRYIKNGQDAIDSLKQQLKEREAATKNHKRG